MTGFPLVPSGVTASTVAVVNGASAFNATINAALPTGTNNIGTVTGSTATVINSAGQTLGINGTVTASQTTAASLKASVLIDGTSNTVQITGTPAVSQSGTWTATPPSITKGTQGSTGFTTQDLKDAGRTYVVLVATGVAGVTSETLFSFTSSTQGVQTNAVTSYTITNAKTLRIQGLYCSNRAGAGTISWTRAVIRHNTAGATTVTSPMILGFEIGVSTGLVNTTAYGDAPIPDGIEIKGNGTQSIGVSHLDQATTNTVTCSLVGYEY